jgi:leucyl aminopeptidase
MKLTFSSKSIDEAPKGFVRVRLIEEPKSTRRLVREVAKDGTSIEWLEIGAGKGSEMNHHRFLILCRSIIMTAKQQKARKIALQFDRTPELFKNLQARTPEQISSLAAQNFEMANFEFRTHKTKPKEGWNQVEELLLCGKSSKSIEAAVKRGQLIGEGVNACRELANTPGGHMTPRDLAKAAKTAVTGLPVTVSTLGRAQIQKLGMGLLAGVGAGSTHEPTFTVMEYWGAGKPATGKASGKPIVLAGKGITFDSGGLNIKPSSGIYEMHMDMSGGAAVIHTVALAAKLKLKKNVIGLIPAAENMLGADATRPGDIHTSLSGKTVEVTDTDAEGRLVLADAITYAKRFDPSVVIDVATLTGAAMVALGLYASGLMTRDDTVAEQMLALSEDTGDFVWRLPLWDEYESIVTGTFADLQNYPLGGSGKYGGATGGGMFLWQFAKELKCPWVHLDIAPRMTSAPGDELAKGAAGAPVRLLLAFIESWKS